jgi:preprotein translocase subunit SecA
VLEEIFTRHERGQPILVGTVSVEVSEMISGELKRHGIEHAVLNAKPEHAQREGELIAQAGRKGAVMIATNMAGRGVDIKLGGDPEHLAQKELKKRGLKPGDEGYAEALAEKVAELEPQCRAEAEEVRELGGLYICGTERHESRRIDNQLRGRSGRQGDPGESRFFLSAEDDVIRLFAGDRIYKILDRLGPVDEEGGEMPLEAKMLTKTVENAQKKVEEQNFLIRKRVLEYDDVMNEQRRVVYKYRREILEGRDMSEVARDELEGVIERLVDEYTPGDELEDWDMLELEAQLRQIWPVGVDVASMPPEAVEREKLKDALDDDAMRAYDEREKQLGEELMRHMERAILLQVIDNRWREHLYDMDYLREGIHLRGFAQIDPLVAYKNEGFSMFQELMHSIWEEFSKLIFYAQVELDPSQLEAAFGPNGEGQPGSFDYSGGTLEGQPSALQEIASAGGAGALGMAAAAAGPNGGNGEASYEVVETVIKDEHDKIGRNDPCWCGSGKKYKKCHGA